MTSNMASLILLLTCLVAMVMAAPVAEQTNQEQVVNVAGDSNVIDRAKRTQEEIVYGNQQNGVKLGVAKKSLLIPPYLLQEKSDFTEKEPQYFNQPDNFDQSGYMFAAKQQAVAPQEKTAEPQGSQEPQPQEPDTSKDVEDTSKNVEDTSKGVEEKGEEEQKEGEQKVPVAPAVVDEQGPEPAADGDNGDKQPSSEVEEVGEQEQATASMDSSLTDQKNSEVTEPEPQTPVISRLPADSRNADAEEALQAQEQVQDAESEDIENFLKELHETNEKGKAEEGVKDGGKEEEEEGSAEAELMQVANQNQEEAEKELDSSEYTKKLLKYILMHGDEYGRFPIGYGYPYPSSYDLQRRRRSSSRHHLLNVQRQRQGGRQLARSKRTKRDLFDDELYYRPTEPYEQEREEEEEEEEKQADMEELISYLMALYPALYDNQPQSPNSQFPGYLWYGSNYPEEAYAEYPNWEEPEYVEVPAGYEPKPPASAWEPAFYPEEVEEEPDYYPAPAKRQMMSMIPSQRRKRYFYPFSREPYTHWGAFIPSQEKRDYDNAYRRLKELAMVLAEARQPSPYFDAFEDYRKK